MIPRKQINKSKRKRIKNCLIMDEVTKNTMKELDLKMFRSAKDRTLDRRKAIAKYSNKVDLSKYAIHHRLDGLVGLAPLEFHKSLGHDGYFYRLSHTTA